MLKAVAGGGGKGMRVVDATGASSPARCARARSEAATAFGDGRGLPRAPDRAARGTSRSSCWPITHGTVVPFVERECSIQRRHQKVVEETPSPVVTAQLRRADGRRRRARSRERVGYTNAGTIEFLLDADGALLLPRDEHAPAGRAPGDRAGDRRRPRRSGRSASPRRAPRRRSGSAAHAARPRHRVPRLRRGSGRAASCRRRGASRACGAPPVPASATTAASPPASRCRSTTTR